MGDTIKLYTRNILETGTVTVTGDPDTGFPETRLYDRAISLYWKDTVTEAKVFHVDQGVDVYDVDFLAIAKHNFINENLAWQWSTNDADWTDAVTAWQQTDNNQIVKTLEAALTKQYWQLTLSSMANPLCSEIFMGAGLSLDVMASPGAKAQAQSNVQWNRTLGGLERSTKFGAARRQRSYPLFVSEANLTALRAALDDLSDLSLPFYIKDHEDAYWLCRLTDDPLENWDHKTHKHLTLSVIEQL